MTRTMPEGDLVTDHRPTYAQVRAAQILIELYESGRGAEPEPWVRAVAVAEPQPLAEPDDDPRPTRAQVRAAQILMRMYEQGHGREPEEFVRRIAASQARPQD